MLVPAPLDITIMQGVPWDITWSWEVDGVPRPLTNHGGTMRLREAGTPHVVSTPATVAGGQVQLTDPGVILISLTHTETAALELGLYEWDYLDVDELSVPHPVWTGRCRVVVP